MNFFKNLFSASPCRHHNTNTMFMDIHRADRWYLRGWVKCKDCDWKKCVAIPMPDTLDFDKLDLTAYYGQLRERYFSK